MGLKEWGCWPDSLARRLNTQLKPPDNRLFNALARQRRLLVLAIVLLCASAWGYTAHLSSQMQSMPIDVMSIPAMTWSQTDVYFMFIMWAVMMVAMMLPSATPAIMLFANVCRQRSAHSRPTANVATFVGGYLLVWFAFSVGATLINWILHTQGFLTFKMGHTNNIIGGTLLIAAGAFQWTPLKDVCLKHCRSPLSFLMSKWREGNLGALRMGIEHGTYCVGCCWLLMALLFALGIMNLAWIAVLSVFVLIEKIIPRGELFARTAGVALVAWGSFILTFV